MLDQINVPSSRLLISPTATLPMIGSSSWENGPIHQGKHSDFSVEEVQSADNRSILAARSLSARGLQWPGVDWTLQVLHPIQKHYTD